MMRKRERFNLLFFELTRCRGLCCHRYRLTKSQAIYQVHLTYRRRFQITLGQCGQVRTSQRALDVFLHKWPWGIWHNVTLWNPGNAEFTHRRTHQPRRRSQAILHQRWNLSCNGRPHYHEDLYSSKSLRSQPSLSPWGLSYCRSCVPYVLLQF